MFCLWLKVDVAYIKNSKTGLRVRFEVCYFRVDFHIPAAAHMLLFWFVRNRP